jgi:hypothetical protein
MRGKLTGAAARYGYRVTAGHCGVRIFCAAALALLPMLYACWGANLPLTDDDPIQLPPVSAYQLRVLSPRMLELTLI